MDNPPSSSNVNTILSTNPQKLYEFVKTLKIQIGNETSVTLTHVLPNIVYTKLMRELPLREIEFRTRSALVFENADYKIACTFKNANKLQILRDTINTDLDFALVEKSNTNDEIEFEASSKHVHVNDKLFSFVVYTKIDKNGGGGNRANLKDELFKVRYAFDQIVEFANGIRIVSSNNDAYCIEYTYKLNERNNANVKSTIDYMIDTISFQRKLIIQNDVYLDNYRQAMNLKSTDKLMRPTNSSNITIETLLDKIDMSHCALRKIDGDRVHVLVYDGTVCYVNSILEVFKLGTCANTNANRILDAELYTHGGLASKSPVQSLYIFNLLYDNQVQNLRDLPLSVKLEKVKEFVHELKCGDVDVHINLPIYNQNNKQEFFKNIYEQYIQKELVDERKRKIQTDGIIFQSILSQNKSWEKKVTDYKWKPFFETSLDFFVRIDKNNLKTPEGNFFRLNLYGFNLDENGNEVIAQFAESHVLIDPRTTEIASICPVTARGEVICENSVIEFNPDFDDNGKISWLPYRVRMDKSLACFHYKRKHGNSIETCRNTLEYLEMPIEKSDIEMLGTDYDKTYDELAKRVQRKRVINRRNPIVDRLFDFVATNVLTSFARWSTYSRLYDRVNMIDLSCGNGVNLFKIYEYAVLMRKNNFFYYGYNENRIQINSPFNGAKSRYEKFRADKTYSNFPVCTFEIYNIFQVLDNVTTKFNHLICLDAYTFQDSKSKVLTLARIIQHLLTPNSYIFIVLADNNLTIDDKNYNINLNIEKCLVILKSTVPSLVKCEAYTFESHVDALDSFAPILSYMTNKKTAEFLAQTLAARDKLRNLSLSNFQFVILYKH